MVCLMAGPLGMVLAVLVPVRSLIALLGIAHLLVPRASRGTRALCLGFLTGWGLGLPVLHTTVLLQSVLLVTLIRRTAWNTCPRIFPCCFLD